jgi:hypothetical protein
MKRVIVTTFAGSMFAWGWTIPYTGIAKCLLDYVDADLGSSTSFCRDLSSLPSLSGDVGKTIGEISKSAGLTESSNLSSACSEIEREAEKSLLDYAMSNEAVKTIYGLGTFKASVYVRYNTCDEDGVPVPVTPRISTTMKNYDYRGRVQKNVAFGNEMDDETVFSPTDKGERGICSDRNRAARKIGEFSADRSGEYVVNGKTKAIKKVLDAGMPDRPYGSPDSYVSAVDSTVDDVAKAVADTAKTESAAIAKKRALGESATFLSKDVVSPTADAFELLPARKKLVAYDLFGKKEAIDSVSTMMESAFADRATGLKRVVAEMVGVSAREYPTKLLREAAKSEIEYIERVDIPY